MNADPVLPGVLRGLWDLDAGDPRERILPRDAARLRRFPAELGRFVDEHPRAAAGRVESGAIVRGELISLGAGSVIEAGAIVHESCRLVLGARSRVRGSAVLRGDVVIGADCLVGAHCEVARSLMLGPRCYLGHRVILLDSVVGRDVNLAGDVAVANTTLRKGGVVLRCGRERLSAGRARLGALIGDRVRFGASTTICPGCVVTPGLALPPRVALYGTIDKARSRTLMRRFFETWGGEGDA